MENDSIYNQTFESRTFSERKETQKKFSLKIITQYSVIKRNE